MSRIGRRPVFEGDGSSDSIKLLLTLIFVLFMSFIFFGGDVLLIF
jgi:hypothetical protein